MSRRRTAGEGSALLPDDPPAGRVLDARLHLLDRQVLDVDDVPVTTVDDLELEPVGPGGTGSTGGPAGTVGPTDASPVGRTVVVTAVLTGPVLATRVLGGRPPSDRWVRVAWRHVVDVGTALRLGVPGETLDATWTERWVRDHVVGRIPGGRRAPR